MRRQKSPNPDRAAQHELEVYIDNDSQLYRQSSNIQKSLARKLCNSTYDFDKAPKAFMQLVESGRKKYEREFGSFPVDSVTKKALAKEYAGEFESRVRRYYEQGIRDLPTEVEDVLKKCDFRAPKRSRKK